MCVPRMFLASREKKRADSLLVASFFSAALRFFFRAAALFFLARVLRADEAFCFDDGTFRRRRLPVEVPLSASIFGCISNNEDITYVLPGNRNSLVYFTLKNKKRFSYVSFFRPLYLRRTYVDSKTRGVSRLTSKHNTDYSKYVRTRVHK